MTLHERGARVLVRFRHWLLLGSLILIAIAIPLAERLELEQSIESFFAPDDPLIVAYRTSRSTFGADEYLLVAYDEPAFRDYNTDDEAKGENFDKELGRLRDFTQQLSEVPGIEPGSSQSLATLLRPPATSPLQARLFQVIISKNIEELIAFGESIVISPDHQTVGIVLKVLPESKSTVPRAETFRRIRQLAQEHAPKAFVAGEPLQVNDIYLAIQEDSTTLGWASSVLLILVILLLFRSVRWVAIPLLVVHAALVWTKAILFLSGMRLSMVSSVVTSLVTIIGIATVTHITVTYREWRKVRDRETALRGTFCALASPIFWTIMTTSIGFASLMTSSINPIQSFGVMMSVGTVMVLMAVLGIVPGAALIGSLDTDPRSSIGEIKLVRVLHRLSTSIDHSPNLLLVAVFLLMIGAGVGLKFLTVETDFSKNFREESQIVEALTFFEDRLGGAGTWEVAFTGPSKLTSEAVTPIRELAESLRTLTPDHGGRLTKVTSLPDGIDLVPGLGFDSRVKKLEEFQPDFIRSLYHQETRRTRLVLRSLERQPAEVKLSLIDDTLKEVRKTYPDAQATGLYVLLANLIISLLMDQAISFLVAGTGILACMTVAFRNFWVGIVSIIPNLFPLLLVMGGMGWCGVPINIGTAMIACVSLGLSVDSSIHYLNGYIAVRRAGGDHCAATLKTHGHVGVALVFANFALVFGFLVLMLSNFVPLIYFGLLVSLSMFGGLVGNLVLLPLLLRWIPISMPQTPSPN
ncbi:MAG: MMPL family transporter [Planctomycetaceae bacterium]